MNAPERSLLARPRIGLGIALFALLLSGGCQRSSTSASGASGRHGGAWGGTAASCEGLAATCGPSENEGCCKSLPVPGGTFYRSYDAVDYLDKDYPATVSDFYLDRYEVTVGRFRRFVNAGMGTQRTAPPEGAGAHPKIPGSGWSSTWNDKLPADTAALKAAVTCYESYQTWTDTPGSNESKPQNCLDWHTAFAFCIWDGGRLPTEAEWNYAASAGAEQRYYPWSNPPSSTAIDASYAVYCGGACRALANVGSKSPKGDGKWGQSDLAGNAWEWTLDWNSSAFPMPCHDCAVVEGGTFRNFKSGAFDDLASTLRTACRHVCHPEYRGIVGARCARSP